jgi:quercetin dioxygenase-like cupin family protein
MRSRDPASWLGAGLAVVAVLGGLADRSRASTKASVQELVAERLPDVPGKELDMLTVEYPPGGASAPHRHDAYVRVYVLKGSVEMQVEAHLKVILTAGQSFIERPDDVRGVSRNAIQTGPAKFLVVALESSAKPLSRDVGPGRS